MRVAIVGSRDYPNLEAVREYVRSLLPGTTVVSGGARGVDRVAAIEANLCGLDVIEILPDWHIHGKSAGFRRNIEIVVAADEVVAFWDGVSKGTLHTITIAKRENKPVKIILPASQREGGAE